MKMKLLAPLALLCLAAPAAFGQGQGSPTRVAVVDTGKVFLDSQELKDLKDDMEAERLRLTGMEKEKRDELQKLQNERNNLKADTPQWDDLNNKLMDSVAEFQLWVQSTKVKAERANKRQVKQLFQHIEAACGEIAKRDGFDLVLADQRPELPDNLDNITFDELRARINSRFVMYAAPKSDVSAAVLSLLDQKYKAAGGGSSRPRPVTGTPKTAAPDGSAPAPAPATSPRPPVKK